MLRYKSGDTYEDPHIPFALTQRFLAALRFLVSVVGHVKLIASQTTGLNFNIMNGPVVMVWFWDVVGKMHEN